MQGSCYSNSALTISHLSPQQLFASDLSFINAQHLGSFQRVWISLDQLMNWNGTTGYAGYNSQGLANVDDMLHRAAAAGLKLDLVLFVYTSDVSHTNEFHPEALDGNHAAMRANYLQAVRDFVTHLAADPIDTSAVAVLDLQQEGYYQLEVYFYTPRHLGLWDYSMPVWPQSEQCYVLGNTLCTGGSAGHGCVSGSGAIDTTCLDVNIIEPWFKDLYTTAKAAAPAFSYTVSDTGRLLTTGTGPYSSQAWQVSLYPVDAYDIHLYSDAPGTETARWSSGLTLPKPWFAGEAGCTSGDTACTYNSTTLSVVYQWWLQNMAVYGARAVLLEDRHTAWTYTYTNGAQMPTLSPTGQFVATTTLATRVNSSPTPTTPPTAMPLPASTATIPPTAMPLPTSTATIPPTTMPLPTSTATIPPTTTPLPTSTATIPPTTTPLPTSTATAAPTSGTSFSTSFDSQAPGALQLGVAPGRFTGTLGSTAPIVESGVAASAP